MSLRNLVDDSARWSLPFGSMVELIRLAGARDWGEWVAQETTVCELARPLTLRPVLGTSMGPIVRVSSCYLSSSVCSRLELVDEIAPVPDGRPIEYLARAGLGNSWKLGCIGV